MLRTFKFVRIYSRVKTLNNTKRCFWLALQSFSDDEKKKKQWDDIFMAKISKEEVLPQVDEGLKGQKEVPDVPGLSSAVVSIPEHEVGSGASKTGVYKNAEYFCYHPMSYYNAQMELSKFRLPQPSAVTGSIP